jgi:hypothetical protein
MARAGGVDARRRCADAAAMCCVQPWLSPPLDAHPSLVAAGYRVPGRARPGPPQSALGPVAAAMKR